MPRGARAGTPGRPRRQAGAQGRAEVGAEEARPGHRGHAERHRREDQLRAGDTRPGVAGPRPGVRRDVRGAARGDLRGADRDRVPVPGPDRLVHGRRRPVHAVAQPDGRGLAGGHGRDGPPRLPLDRGRGPGRARRGAVRGMTVQRGDVEPEDSQARKTPSSWQSDPNFTPPERVPWSELGPDFIRIWGRADEIDASNVVFWPRTRRTGTERRAFHEVKIRGLLDKLWQPQANTIVGFDEVGYVESLSGDMRALVQMYWRDR